MNLSVNTDGASRGNPGPSSYGFVIKDKISGVILHQEGRVIENGTNNIAEYTAVLRALEYIIAHYSHKAPHQVEIVADSLLVVQQLKGVFKVKNPRLKLLFDKIKILEIDLGGDVKFRHVPREQNFIADRMANKALDEKH